MRSSRRSRVAKCVVAAIGIALSAHGLHAAEETESLRALIEQQSQQIDAQSRQIESLRQRLDAISPTDSNPSGFGPGMSISPVLPTSATPMMAIEAADQNPVLPSPGGDGSQAAQPTSRLGNVVAANASWKDGFYLWLDSPDKQFTMHLGGWMQFDSVFWNQQSALKAAPGPRPGHAQGVASGAPADGIGDLQNGEYFRRIRPFAEGTFYGVGEYRLILALENDQFETTGLDEFWIAVNEIPLIGTIRAGHVKNALGLEGDMTSSSRTMTFMERSSYSEAIELNQNFVTGLWFSNTYFDQRTMWEAVFFKSNISSSTGVAFGDGQWGAQARVTGLPIYEDNGCELLHLGISGGWRSGTNNLAVSPLLTTTLSARPELRDDDPAASPSGGQPLPNADSNRMVSTGSIAASGDFLLGTEILCIRGPLSVQGEYGWNFISNAIGIAPTGLTLNPPITPPQDYVFSGGYIQIAYTLTGEHRAYDKRIGTLDRKYYGKDGPASNVFGSRDEEGHVRWGSGAWEVAARYSFVDLNDGSGLNRIQGGDMQGLSLALNWYLNSNLNLMFDWVRDYRYALPEGTFAGYTSGLGVELQAQF